MKKFVGYLIAGAVGLAGGLPLGWLMRKKLGEVQFQEVTEEEQTAEMIKNGDEKFLPVNKAEIKRPEDIQKAIDGLFAKPDVPDNLADSTKKAVENEQNREAGIRQMDTQKVQYFKQWKEEASDPAEKYDTRSDDIAEDSVDLPEDARQFVEEIGDDGTADPDGEDEHFGDGKPTIELAGPEDWERWESKDNGAYDCVELYWFDEDDVLSDEDGNQIESPMTYLGFDAERMFDGFDAAEGERLSGEADTRYVYNHKQHAIFKLNRRHTSFSRKRGMEEYGNDYDGDENDAEEYLRSRQ